MSRKSKRRKGRRARGTGSIFFHEGRQSWVGRKVVGRTPAGKPVRVERWGATQAEVVEKLAAATPPGPGTTVGEWAARWLAAVQVRPRTQALYAVAVRDYITPAVGPVRLTALTAGDVERAWAGWVSAAEPLMASTARVYVAVLSACLRAAVRSGLVAAAVTAAARKPRPGRKKIDPYTPEQLARVVALSAARPGAEAVALLSSTGCRIGEACALDVTDFDAAAGAVAVTKTYTPGAAAPGPPKSPYSVRTVRVPAAALPAVVTAAGGRSAGPLFLRAGRRVTPIAARAAWYAVCRGCGLPPKNPHQLRHSVATALIAAGVPLGDVAAYLGDTVATVVKTYVHASGTDPAAAMDGLLGGRKVGGGWAGRAKPKK